MTGGYTYERPMDFRVVTTCNANGWQETGRRMAQTFAEFWPAAVTLEIYAENFDIDVEAPNIIQRRLPYWHADWKRRHADNADAHGRDPRRFGRVARRKDNGYSYRRDCVRFSHKVAALTDAVIDHPSAAPGWLIMCDADTLTHSRVTIDWLTSIIPDQQTYVAWLHRRAWYPECGFVLFRETHPQHGPFMDDLAHCYWSDAVFAYSETHDSYVLQQRVVEAVRAGRIPPAVSLSGPAGERSSHPFVHSRLAECLDHAKGKFKAQGRTPKGYVTRGEAHWK